MIEKILLKCEELFFSYGVKSITMDDLAKHLGISKKTLYQYVDNKADLVNKTLASHLEKEKISIDQIRPKAKNAIDEMFQVGNHVTNHLRSLNPSVVYDLKKYYPETWEKIVEHKNTFIYRLILNNIKRGIEEGIYLQDIDPDIIAKVYSARAEFVVDQEIFPIQNYSVLHVYEEYLKYHIRGIASLKGLQYLEKQKLD